MCRDVFKKYSEPVSENKGNRNGKKEEDKDEGRRLNGSQMEEIGNE